MGARGGATGTALSLVTPGGEEIVARLMSDHLPEDALQLLQLNMKDIECFRYRVSDVQAVVNKKTIHKARVRCLQQEALTSTKLQAHFEENPEDKHALRVASRKLKVTSGPDSLKTIPG